jgi:hypothetical protein
MSRRKRYTRNFGRVLKEPLPVRATTEWVRFEHEREPYGIFSYRTLVRERLRGSELAEFEALVDWFFTHLDAPEEATQERFWFRGEAVLYIEKARRLMALHVAAGIPIVERRTRRVPGKIRWEDPDQVAVFTYRDAPRPR